LTGRRRQTFDDPDYDGPTWSGVGADAPEGTRIDSVSGCWTVPNAYPPGRGDLQSYECTSWVGIDDGMRSADIIQAGVHSIVYDFPNFPFSTASPPVQIVYPWWEWVPGPEVAITNFPVLPGDTVGVSIYVFSPQEAQISLWNTGPGTITNFIVTNNPAVTSEYGEEFAGFGMPDIAGVCAEWILERPKLLDAQGQKVPAKLANYGSVFFYLMGAGASRDDGATELPTQYQTFTMNSSAGVLSSSSGRIVTQDAGTYTSAHCTFHHFE
jgi:Peptidase A4 family